MNRPYLFWAKLWMAFNGRFAMAAIAFALTLTQSIMAKTVEKNGSMDGFSDTQGRSGWSYACINSADITDLWNKQLMLSYNAATQTWQRSMPGGPVVQISATQQNKFEGAGIASLRYWTADRDYQSVAISSTLTATVPLGAYIALVDNATHTTTRIGSTCWVTTTSLASSSGTQNLVIGGTLSSISPGDQIYFVLRNDGSGAGHGTLQTWNQAITVEGPMTFGVHAQSRGTPSGYLSKANSIYALSGSGAYVRDAWNWNNLQPTSGNIDWTLPDSAVATALANGQKLIVSLCFAPAWANGGLDITWPATDVNLWKTYVSSVVSRYKNSGVIKGWELWNEENTPLFLENGLQASGTLASWQIRADDYANKILIPGYQAIRSIDSSTPVILGGMAFTGTASNGVDNTTHGFFKRVLDTSPTACASFDYTGYHAYANVTIISSIFDQVKAEMANHGIDRPIAVTEFGALSPATSDSNAIIATQIAAVLKTKNVSQACMHYSIDCEGLNYGLFDSNIAQPTSLQSLNTSDWRLLAYGYYIAIAELDGYDYASSASFTGTVPAHTVGYIYNLRTAPTSSKVIAVWNYSGTATVNVLTGGNAKSAVISLRSGTAVATTPATITGTGTTQQIQLSINANPAFIEVSY